MIVIDQIFGKFNLHLKRLCYQFRKIFINIVPEVRFVNLINANECHDTVVRDSYISELIRYVLFFKVT